MKKIMFNDKYGLTQAVLDGRKTMTRRIISNSDKEWFRMQYGEEYERWMRNAPFVYLEELAIAQSFKDLGYPSDTIQRGRCIRKGSHHPENEWDDVMIGQKGDWFIDQLAGWENKMFVPASMCNHHIRITDIKIERLQGISEEDAKREGVLLDEELTRLSKKNGYGEMWRYDDKHCYGSARSAFANLIDKVSGKGTWNRSPYVFAYTFELID